MKTKTFIMKMVSHRMGKIFSTHISDKDSHPGHIKNSYKSTIKTPIDLILHMSKRLEWYFVNDA